MISTAQALAEALNAEVFDASRQPFTADSERTQKARRRDLGARQPAWLEGRGRRHRNSAPLNCGDCCTNTTTATTSSTTPAFSDAEYDRLFRRTAGDGSRHILNF